MLKGRTCYKSSRSGDLQVYPPLRYFFFFPIKPTWQPSAASKQLSPSRIPDFSNKQLTASQIRSRNPPPICAKQEINKLVSAPIAIALLIDSLGLVNIESLVSLRFSPTVLPSWAWAPCLLDSYVSGVGIPKTIGFLRKMTLKAVITAPT